MALNPLMVNSALALLILGAMLGALSCVVVWRRMANIGDSISHAALLGVVFSLITGGALPPQWGIGLMALLVGAAVLLLTRHGKTAPDTALALLAQVGLAGGMVLVSLFGQRGLNLHQFLFGDVLAVQVEMLWWLAAMACSVLALVCYHWRSWVMVTLSPDIAAVEGVNPHRVHAMQLLLLALVIGVASQWVGVLLVTALLVIPAAAASLISRSPASMVWWSSAIAIAASLGGLHISFVLDSPTSATIVLVAAGIFALCGLFQGISQARKARIQIGNQILR